jgi:single-strand DNA-binding protein
MQTTFHVVGTIATDPKLIQAPSGVQLCSFRLASDERRYDRQQQAWIDGTTNWFSVSTFRSLALNAHASFHKGDRVIVSGKLRVRNWEKDEKRGTSVEIEADAVGHDVRWGVSQFQKHAASRTDDDSSDAETYSTAPGEAGSEFFPAVGSSESPFAGTEPTAA